MEESALEFYYDGNGLNGFKYDNNQYIYRKNAQGDITHILDMTGNTVVKYVYDAWGNHTCVYSDGTPITDPNHVGNLNPFRYRSYFYDVETDLYFLQTRYYDPQIGRFISQDDVSYLDPENINGLNLYAYCGSNPVMGYDPTGTWDWKRFLKGVLVVVLVVAAVAITIATCGAGSILGTILIAGAIGAGAEMFSQAVIQNKALGDINYLQVAIAGIGAAVSAIPGVGLGLSMLIGGATSGLITLAGGGNWKEVLLSAAIGAIGAGIGYGVGKLVGRIGAAREANKLAQLSTSEMKQAMKPFFKQAEINSAKHLSYVLTNRPEIPRLIFGKLIPQAFNSATSASIGIGLSLIVNKLLFDK